MLNLKINNVKIKGISTVVPKKEFKLEDDETLYDGNKKRLKRVMSSTGFNCRRVADEKTTSSDLCVKAAENLFSEMNYNRKELQAVVFVTQTPDYYMPATACILQDRLNLSQDIATFDVNQGCAGYVYGLWIASSLISGGLKKVLLLVGDTSAKYTDMFRDGSAPIFGDAGSATILEYESQMDGARVMEFTLDKVPLSIKELLEKADEKIENIDYFIMHQANRFILENIAMNADIPFEKMPTETISKYGNQSCTSIPSAICDTIYEEVSNKNVKLLLSGFGIGLTWASCITTLDKITCIKINEY